MQMKVMTSIMKVNLIRILRVHKGQRVDKNIMDTIQEILLMMITMIAI